MLDPIDQGRERATVAAGTGARELDARLAQQDRKREQLWRNLLVRPLRELSERRPARIDWWGNATFALGLIGVMVGITYGIQPYGGHTMGWTAPLVLSTLLDREVKSFFYTPIAYVVLFFFLLITGFNFWTQINALNNLPTDFTVVEAFFMPPIFWFAISLCLVAAADPRRAPTIRARS